MTEEELDDLIFESAPESVRNRIRRRTKRDPVEKHQDEAGHQPVDPTFNDRIVPMRTPMNKQDNGRGRQQDGR